MVCEAREGLTLGVRMKHRILSQALGPCWCMTPTHRLLVQAVTGERLLKNMDSQKVTLRATWGARLEFQEVPGTRAGNGKGAGYPFQRD